MNNSARVPKNYMTTMSMLHPGLNPNQYYWNHMVSSIGNIVKDEQVKEHVVNQYKTRMDQWCKDLNCTLDSSKLYSVLAYYACDLSLMEACVTNTYQNFPYVAFALEYYKSGGLGTTTDTPYEKDIDPSKFYQHSSDRLWNFIRCDSTNRAMLNGIVKKYSYPVINVDEIKKDYKKIVKSFYSERPHLLLTRRPIEELQELFNNVTNDLESSINQEVDRLNIVKQRKTDNFSF